MNKLIKYGTALILFTASTQLCAKAQQVDFFRTELHLKGVDQKYADVSGSPYVFEKWVPGTIKTVDNKVKTDILLKYDEIEDVVIMSGDNDQMLKFSVPIAEFTLIDPKTNASRIFRSGFTASKDNSEKVFFEVIQDGKVKLLKKNHKVISKSTAYSGAVNKTVADALKYYSVTADDAPVGLKLDQKSIFAVLADKEAQLTEYTKVNKLNLKKEADVATLIKYYNTL